MNRKNESVSDYRYYLDKFSVSCTGLKADNEITVGSTYYLHRFELEDMNDYSDDSDNLVLLSMELRRHC